MIIYPAIDIKNGKCVRLQQGRASVQTIYGDDPVEVAARWHEAGAKWLHVVDLDGAFAGASVNVNIIKRIIDEVDIPVQLGGGLRNMDAIKYALEEIGVSRVVLGTVAVEHPSLVAQAVQKYGNGIAVGIDAKDGMVAIRGWIDVTEFQSMQLAAQMLAIGVKTIIYTDISRDGMLVGPNFKAISDMVQMAPVAEIIASGGVASIDDVKQLKSIGVAGIVIGKALYDGRIELEDALKLEEDAIC